VRWMGGAGLFWGLMLIWGGELSRDPQQFFVEWAAASLASGLGLWFLDTVISRT
jgi:hypothetical protein